MDKLDQIALFEIAIHLDLPDLLRFCSSSKRINRLICQKEPIWRTKLESDFPEYLNFKIKKSFRERYNLLYSCLLYTSPSPRDRS